MGLLQCRKIRETWLTMANYLLQELLSTLGEKYWKTKKNRETVARFYFYRKTFFSKQRSWLELLAYVRDWSI